MGCYDSSILRPLLGRSSENNGIENNNTSNRKNGRWLWFWKRKRGYNGMEDGENLDDIPRVGFRRGSSAIESVMGAGHKIGLLIWKNLLLRKRHYVVTALEIILPTLFSMVLVYGRSQATKDAPGLVSSNPSFLGKNVDPDIYRVYDERVLKISCGPYFLGKQGKCLVAFAPNTSDVTQIISDLSATLDSQTKLQMDWRGFSSESDVEKYVASLSFNEVTGGDETLRAAIIFPNGLKPLNGILKYKIRLMDSSSFPSEVMSSLYPWLQLPGPDFFNEERYRDSGFTAFQLNLDKVLIKRFALGQSLNHTVLVQAFPYPPHERNVNFSEFYFLILPNVLIIGFIFIVPSVIRGVVNERETGIKELMKLCGLPNWMHWFAWTVNSMIFLSISVTIVIILYFTDYLNPEAGPIIARSNPLVWWLVLMLYVLASTAFCFFVSSFFQRPTIAITVGIILWLTTFYAPSTPLGDSNKYLSLSLCDKMLVALLPNMALYWALKVMCGFEGKASGAQWNNMFSTLSSTDNLTLGHVMFMMIVDTILYFLLTLYVEAVLPSQYGIRKPWYFIFTSKFWGRSEPELGNLQEDDEEEDGAVKPGFEHEPHGLKAGVVIKNLRKRFGRNKVAVNGVTVKMYDGEIFALLGHNGAGKTTTISCCIGMLAPSRGTAIINDYDIRKDLDKVREQLGLCPQHNLIFDELTVDEHLTFFGRLKGLGSEEARQERVEMLQKLQLTEKTHVLARSLSGGQKRKLCLGISLIGKAKVVFLDEPTSGMDVEARRSIWNLLLGERGQRTIVLTTHFMEEADVLGDRIGIMAHGKLQCCGTSLFLKKYYGTGYTLSMIMADEQRGRKEEVLSLVQNYVPNASLKDSNHQQQSNFHECSIVLPSGSSSTTVFPKMFEDLQKNKDALKIQSMSVTMSTMDDVFIKVDEDASDGKRDDNTSSSFPADMVDGNSPSEASVINHRTHRNGGAIKKPMDIEAEEGSKAKFQGLSLLKLQFQGLLMKRLQYTMRKWKLVLTQVSIPIFILIIAILAGNTQLQPPTHSKPLTMGLSSYPKPITMYSSEDKLYGREFAALVGSSAREYVGNESFDLVQELIRIGEIDLSIFRERHIVAAEFTNFTAKAMFSTIPYHGSPLAINFIMNTLLKSASLGKDTPRLEVTNHPLQGGFEYLLQALQPDPAFSVSVALMFGALAPIGLALLAASFIVAPVEERLCKGKQLQLMTGVNPIVYWGSSFIWDFFMMACVVLVMVICFPLFQKASTYTSHGGAGVIFLILLTYGFSAIPMSYIISLFAGTVPGGFSFVTIIHIVTGMIVPFVVYVMEAAPGLSSISDTIRTVGRFFPTYGASFSTMRFIEIALKNSRCSLLPDNAEELLCDAKVRLEPHLRQCCSNCRELGDVTCMEPVPYLSWYYKRVTITSDGVDGVPGIGQELVYMFLIGLAYQVILILLELGFIQKIATIIRRTKREAFQKEVEDNDVQLESERVHDLVRNGKVNEDALVVEDFCKNYGTLAAVANLNFGVHNGECFGLLGVNGAGKTTTFRMLTGDEIRSNGNSYACGYDLNSSKKQFLGKLGYCPQFDGIIGVLTGREMVELFARLRGVQNVSRDCDKWLSRVGLLDSKNVQCRKYSGGMKRRLSAAMAMVGDPEIVLLDEPTSGVDPVSRREFWKIISSIRESGRSIILTSHSMDEITACCSRLGIMVNGSLQCLGSVQHLKNKFAQGYTLALKLKQVSVDQEETIRTLESEIISKFSPCVLKDKHQTALQYHIQDVSLSWSLLFGIMEDLKCRFPSVIEDYSITETTLEEVFLAFARKQYPNREANISLLRRILSCQF